MVSFCMRRTLDRSLLLIFATSVALSTSAAETYSPHVEESFATDVYWGDTHVHTSYSWDAWTSWNRISPEEAYRFAKGETVTAHNGQQVRLHRPLDFLLVADHAENIGFTARVAARDKAVLSTEEGRLTAQVLKENPSPVSEVLNGGDVGVFQRLFNTKYAMLSRKADTKAQPAKETDEPEKPIGLSAKTDKPAKFPGTDKPKKFPRIDKLANYTNQIRAAQKTNDVTEGGVIRRSIWEDIGRSAERHNDPGKFTAFIGFEWTFGFPGAPSLHRNVIFADGASVTNQVQPLSAKKNSANASDLWQYMADYEQRLGGRVLAIPHNGNLSNGAMFRLNDLDSNSSDYARSRARWEPLYEVTQIKGDGETHPLLSPNDEFADYETWNGFDMGNWQQRLETEYARSALQLGLAQQAKLGANPFKFGMIGSTDSHTSLATADDNNFWGKDPLSEPSQHRVKNAWFLTASGYAAVWAKENTRDSLFEAMRRREVYASTGPRITLRLFAGWEYGQEDAQRADFVRVGYAKGVPMGGDLTSAPAGKSPTLLIRAARDPESANLDRIQVIKGWRDATGALHEKIYDVALSGQGRKNQDGGVVPVGNTVDIANATYTNTIGDPELSVVWTDPDFNKDRLAFYYVRVLEIPTPRWTAYDARYFGLKDLTEDIQMLTQERAYSSPIWYTP
jgi:hypothetical protein